jgi:glutaredoxin
LQRSLDRCTISPMEKPKIIAYLKPHCGWSQGVRAVLRKYDLAFEDRDIWNDPRQRLEMIQKSGQELSPCVEVDGRMLPDISGEELEAWLVKSGVTDKDHAPVDVPLNAPCADHGEVISTPITLKR